MAADQQAAYAAAFAADLDRLHATARRLPLKTRARLAVLLGRLAPADQRDLLGLVLLAEEEGFDRGVTEVDAQWRLLVDHFPGIAPAIDVVRAHCADRPTPGCGCDLPPSA